MNYLTWKLWFCQEIVKQALLLSINQHSLTDDELSAKLSDAFKIIIQEESNSEYDIVMEALRTFYVMINEYSESEYSNTSKIAKSVKIKPTDTSSFTEYIADLKNDITHHVEILQQSYIEHINKMLVGSSIKFNIANDIETFEQVLALVKEPIKFNINQTSSSSANLSLTLIDHSLPFASISYSESDDLIEFKIASSKKIKINKTSKTTYRYYPSLYELYLLKKYDEVEWNNINNLELDQIYGREI